MKALFDEAEVRKTLARIIKHGAVFEVRALDAKLSTHHRAGTVSGYFNNPDACVAELRNLTSAKGIYVTLNPVNPALLARCANRLDYAEKNATTNDQHILERRWLPLDVDADRPSGIRASDSEKEAAHKKAREIHDYLKGRGWPPPLLADSGNGFHLLYPSDQDCDDNGLFEKVLAAIAHRFDGNGVKIDKSVFNPARIARLYGTLAAKGDDTVERPHRLSKILKTPLRVVVTTEQLRALVDELLPAEPAQVELLAARNGAFDIEGFLSRCAVEVKERTTEPDGTIKWLLAHCPFNHDHVDGEAAVFQSPAGKLGFKCFHNSCSDKHWKDFRRHFEPERKATSPRVDLQSPADSEPVDLPPPPAPYVPPPLMLLPSQLQEYVHAAAESLNVDVSFILLPMLSSLGTAIGNSRSILLKPDFIQPPVIWTAIIQRSGYLKSPAIEAGCFAVMEHEHELMRGNKQVQELYENDLAEWKAKKPSRRGAEPAPPALLTCAMDDLTIEALADVLAVNPRGVLVAKDEISHWFASFDQYRSHGKGSDVSRWLSLHTAVRFALNRLTDKRHLRIPQPRVCITGGIQPKVLRRVLTEDFFERGLPARFLFAFPSAAQIRWSEATIPDDLRNSVLQLFEKIWLLEPEHDGHGTLRPKLLGLGKDGKSQYVAFYNECGKWAVAADEKEEAAWNKLSGYAARLALVGQVAHNPEAEAVTEKVMAPACDMARWFGKEAVRIYASLAETHEQREQRELCEFIERRGGAVYEREVMQSFTRLKNDKLGTERELTALVKAGRGKWELVDHGGGPGRPARKFRLLRPSTSTQFGVSRGKTDNFVDVDRSSSQKITPSDASEKEAETLIGDALGVGRL
jgi:hypothetical protein